MRTGKQEKFYSLTYVLPATVHAVIFRKTREQPHAFISPLAGAKLKK
jgi:hypothetical protein